MRRTALDFFLQDIMDGLYLGIQHVLVCMFMFLPFIFLIEHSVWSSGSKLRGHDVAIGKKQKKTKKCTNNF